MYVQFLKAFTRKSLAAGIFCLVAGTCVSQEKLQWTECFAGKQAPSYLRARQQTAEKWGIDYRYMEFYADSLQCFSTDSLAWIHDRYFKANEKYRPQFNSLQEKLSVRYGNKWLQAFNEETQKARQNMFAITAGDSACYPYPSYTSMGYYGSYCADTVDRGCIDLRTLKVEKNKPVPVNNFNTLGSGAKNNIQYDTFRVVKNKKKKAGFQSGYFVFTDKGRSYKIQLEDTSGVYYNELYAGNIKLSFLKYNGKVIFVAQPMYGRSRELIIYDPEIKKIEKRMWVGPGSKGYPNRPAMVDEVCDYREVCMVSRYENRLIVDIDVVCNLHSLKDRLYIIDLKTYEVKEFDRAP